MILGLWGTSFLGNLHITVRAMAFANPIGFHLHPPRTLPPEAARQAHTIAQPNPPTVSICQAWDPRNEKKLGPKQSLNGLLVLSREWGNRMTVHRC